MKLKIRAIARSHWWSIVIAGIVFVLLGVAIWSDWETISAFDWRINIKNLILYIVFHALALGAIFIAWHLMMRRMLGDSRLRRDMRIYSLSILARRIPFPIWYVGSRVVLYKAEKAPASLILTATALEIALLGFGGVTCYLILLPWYTYSQAIPWYIPMGVVVIGMLIFFLQPGLFINILNSIRKFRHKPEIDIRITRADLITWALLYLAPWFLDGIGLYYALTTFLQLPEDVFYVIGISTLTQLVGLLSMILPAGFGLKELMMGTLLSIWIPISAGVVLSILYRIMNTVIETIWVLTTTYTSEELPQ